MDFKRFLIWVRPTGSTVQELDTNVIERAKTRDKLTRSDMPRFSEKDGKGIYEYLAEKEQLTAHSFGLWLDYLAEKSKHNCNVTR